MARNASAAIVDALQLADVRCVFGCPGTTELPFIAALEKQSDIRYVTCLLDGVAVGIADGYARASRRVGVVNLHAGQGTLNAAGFIRAAYRDNSAVVVVAGMPSLSYSMFEPNHFVHGLVDMLRPATKWGWHVTHADEAPLAVTRAINIANSPPKGPVVVGVPQDVLVAECGSGHTGFHVGHELKAAADASLLDRAAALLAEAGRPLVLAGNAVGRRDASAGVRELAERLGAPVISEALDRGPQVHAMSFPSNHPHSLGFFDTRDPLIRELLDRCDVLLVLGCKATYSRVIGSLSPTTKVIQADESPAEIGKNHAVEVGLVGDLGTVVAGLRERLTESRALPEEIGRAAEMRRRERREALRAVELRGSPVTAMQLARALVETTTERTVFVDDSQSFGGYVKRYIEFSRPGSLYGSMASHMGWALPAAVGIQAARPAERVVSLVSDGSFLLSVQALVTAARFEIPVVAVVVNNRSFVSLRMEIERYASFSESELGCLDLSPPDLDYASVATGCGVRASTVRKAEELVDVLNEAQRDHAPRVVDVVMSSRPEDWSEGWYIAPPR